MGVAQTTINRQPEQLNSKRTEQIKKGKIMKTLERIATFVAYIVLLPVLLVDIPKNMWEWKTYKMSVAVWCVRAWLHSVRDIVRY